MPSTPREGKKTLYAEIPAGLMLAFDAYLESLRPPSDKTAAVVVCLEDFLEKKGFWPPKKDGKKK